MCLDGFTEPLVIQKIAFEAIEQLNLLQFVTSLRRISFPPIIILKITLKIFNESWTISERKTLNCQIFYIHIGIRALSSPMAGP